MRPQGILFVRTIANHKVHNRFRWIVEITCNEFESFLCDSTFKRVKIFYNKKYILSIERFSQEIALTSEYVFLHRPHIFTKEVQPLPLEADLFHMNVSRWNILISACEPWIL